MKPRPPISEISFMQFIGRDENAHVHVVEEKDFGAGEKMFIAKTLEAMTSMARNIGDLIPMSFKHEYLEFYRDKRFPEILVIDKRNGNQPVAAVKSGTPVIVPEMRGRGIGREIVKAAWYEPVGTYLAPTHFSVAGYMARMAAFKEAWLAAGKDPTAELEKAARFLPQGMRMGAVRVDYTDKHSLKDLSNKLAAKISAEKKPLFLGEVIVAGLFEFSTVDEAGMRCGVGDLISMMDIPPEKQVAAAAMTLIGHESFSKHSDEPMSVGDIFERFREHLVNGRDMSDLRSAGGFSHGELERLSAICKRFDIEVDLMPAPVNDDVLEIGPEHDYGHALASPMRPH